MFIVFSSSGVSHPIRAKVENGKNENKDNLLAIP
jgi:hypothetical protein